MAVPASVDTRAVRRTEPLPEITPLQVCNVALELAITSCDRLLAWKSVPLSIMIGCEKLNPAPTKRGANVPPEAKTLVMVSVPAVVVIELPLKTILRVSPAVPELLRLNRSEE